MRVFRLSYDKTVKSRYSLLWYNSAEIGDGVEDMDDAAMTMAVMRFEAKD